MIGIFYFPLIVSVEGTNLSPISYCPLWEWAKGRYSSLGSMLIRQRCEAFFPDVGSNKSMRVALALGPFPKWTIPDWGKIYSSHKSTTHDWYTLP